MHSINHSILGHQFRDLQSYDTDVPALSNNSVRGPFPAIAHSHLSPNMDSMQPCLAIEKQRQNSMSPVHPDLPSRSVSRSPYVGGGAYPFHCPQNPTGSTSTSYSTSLFTPAPLTGPHNYPALYRPSNPRAQSKDGLYCRDTPRDTSSHLPLPRQRRNTYSGYSPGRRPAMAPPRARSLSETSATVVQQEMYRGFVHQELVRALLDREVIQNDSGNFLFDMEPNGTDLLHDNLAPIERPAQHVIPQAISAQGQAHAREKSAPIYVSLEQLGIPPDHKFAGEHAQSRFAIVEDESSVLPPVLPHRIGAQDICQPTDSLALGLPNSVEIDDQIFAQTDEVDGGSGYIEQSDVTGACNLIPGQVKHTSGSIANSGIAPNSFEDPGQAESAPAVSSLDLYNSHTSSSTSAGSVHATDVPHELTDEVPYACTRGSASASSPTAPATPPARPTRSRRKVKQQDGGKKVKQQGGDKKVRKQDGESKVKKQDADGEMKLKQQDGEQISFRGRCAPRHKSGDIWVMGTMSGHTIDNPLQKGVKAWQDPLLMDEWNGEKAERVPKLALFEQIVEFSVDPLTDGGEGKKRGRDEEEEADVAPALKKARVAGASKGNRKGNGSEVSLSGTSTGTVTLRHEPNKTSGSAAGGEGPSTGADHIFSLGPREG